MRPFKYLIVCIALLFGITSITPFILGKYISFQYTQPDFEKEFPVTVNPENKTITENKLVDAYFQEKNLYTQTRALLSIQRFEEIFLQLVMSLSEVIQNYNLALVNSQKFVYIPAGSRKEEVAYAFARTLGWSEKEKKEFLLAREEGSFFPGVYALGDKSTPQDVENLIDERFTKNVLARYSTSTREIVPLKIALTVASLIQRETIGTDDMRLVSGIIWNRIFKDMNLQIDATLQYVKATRKGSGIWWPEVNPQDKYIRSPYNTYRHSGLPPTPIASPSVAAILAALNPTKTDCIFYFHDKDGDFHCSPTYKEHITLLKKYYGRGK